MYGDDYDEIVQDIAESMRLMLEQEVDRIILVCGTAHYFLDGVYKIIPQAKEKVVDIIEVLGKELRKQEKNDVLIIAAEGTLLRELYPSKLKKYGISCVNPSKQYYEEIRYFIECVKQDKYDVNVGKQFVNFLNNFSVSNIVLGCTEFPVLVEHIVNHCMTQALAKEWKKFTFIDPLEVVLRDLKRTLK